MSARPEVSRYLDFFSAGLKVLMDNAIPGEQRRHNRSGVDEGSTPGDLAEELI